MNLIYSMKQLQFIHIITDHEAQTSPEEIRLAFDGFMQYCREQKAGPEELQDILYMKEILTYTLRESSTDRSKKKSSAPYMYLRGVGCRRSSNTHRRVQNAVSAGRIIFAR